MKTLVYTVRLFFLFLSCSTMLAQSIKIDGSMRLWHKIRCSFEHPVSQLEVATTFKNYRFDVIFSAPSGAQYRVPGFFAADGRAADSSADQGRQFEAYLRPNETGIWSYEALFYEGTDVATMNIDELPSPKYSLTGTLGNIVFSNKIRPDFRARGRLSYQVSGTEQERRYLRFQGDRSYFLKMGPDSPENMLDYADFDFEDSPRDCPNCFVHQFEAHADDYQTGNPVWSSGKGKGIMGVINALAAAKMNALSMSLFGGDDLNVFPWTKRSATSIFDVSKLAQWELVFDHAESKGLLLHFKLAENENWDALSDVELRLYYREMVARFGHHLAIEWNISEEYRGSASSSVSRIQWLATIDPYLNHRVIHTYPGEHDKYQDWLDLKAPLTGASIQSASGNDYDTAYDGLSGVKTWIVRSRDANHPWVVSSDEQNSGTTGVFTTAEIANKQVVKEARTRILWKTLLAGGAGVMWYGGSKGDFRTEDFGRFDTLFSWSRYAIQDFFMAHEIPFWTSENRDDLVGGSSAVCLAQEGQSYIIYLENGGSTSLDLTGTQGEFDVYWFNPRTGGDLLRGSVKRLSGGSVSSIGIPPSDTIRDWVVWVARTVNSVLPPNPVDDVDCDADYEEIDRLVVIEAENLADTSSFWEVDSSTPGATGTGCMRAILDASKPNNGVLETTIKINNPGKYRVQWRSKVGIGTSSTDHNDSWLIFPDASDYYAEKGTSKVYPLGSGKTPNPTKGGGIDGWFKVWSSGPIEWIWWTSTWDSNSHFIYAEFDSPGLYTMQISARSKGHLIDRIVLYQEDFVNNARDLTQPETPCGQVLTVQDFGLDTKGIVVYPIPATNNLQVQGLRSDAVVILMDAYGREVVLTENGSQVSGTRSFALTNLVAGVYFLKISGHGLLRIVKE